MPSSFTIFTAYIQPSITGLSSLFLVLLSILYLFSLTCSKNPFKKQLKLQRKLFVFICMNALCRTSQSLVLNLMCPDVSELRKGRVYCEEWPSRTGDAFVHISVERVGMCLDWIATAASFFTLWSLTFFWVEQFMSLQNVVGSAAVVRRRGSLDVGAERGSLLSTDDANAASSSVYYSGPKPLSKSSLHRIKAKLAAKAHIIISVVFWSMVILVSTVCAIACICFFFTPISYGSIGFAILRLVYRVSLSLIQIVGIVYFGLKISIVFRNQYSKLLIKIAIITVVCSCSYIILSFWNVLSFILYRVGQMARDNDVFTTATVLIFSMVELIANAILLIALTPDTLLCCCRNVQDTRRLRMRKRGGSRGAGDLYGNSQEGDDDDETASELSNDLGEALLKDDDMYHM